MTNISSSSFLSEAAVCFGSFLFLQGCHDTNSNSLKGRIEIAIGTVLVIGGAINCFLCTGTSVQSIPSQESGIAELVKRAGEQILTCYTNGTKSLPNSSLCLGHKN